MSSVLPISFLAFALTVLGHTVALHLFPQIGLLDFPKRYHLKRTHRLPYPAGVVPAVVFLGIFLAISPWTTKGIGLGVGVGILTVVSFLDDRFEVNRFLRLSLQILIALLIFATGSRIYTITSPLGGLIKLDTVDIPAQFSILNSQFSNPFGPLPLYSGLFTVAWILLTTNAFNWFDGIPGQVNVLTTIGATTLGLLALSSRVQQPEVAALAFILAACALGSAFFDFPPNRVVLGDTGAMTYGFLLGALSIYAGGKVATAFLVLGLPLIDAVLVLLRRFLKGEPLSSGNLDHLHHRLLRKGWTERQIIALTVVLGTAFGITALFLDTWQKFLATLILGLIVLWLTWYSRTGSEEVRMR